MIEFADGVNADPILRTHARIKAGNKWRWSRNIMVLGTIEVLKVQISRFASTENGDETLLLR